MGGLMEEIFDDQVENEVDSIVEVENDFAFEISEVIDLELGGIEEVSIKEFQNKASEVQVFWSSDAW